MWWRRRNSRATATESAKAKSLSRITVGYGTRIAIGRTSSRPGWNPDGYKPKMWDAAL